MFEPGDLVTIAPRSSRFPQYNALRGKTGHVMHVEPEFAEVLVGKELVRVYLTELVPGPHRVKCAACGGSGQIPRLGICQILPGRQWRDCPTCDGRGLTDE